MSDEDEAAFVFYDDPANREPAPGDPKRRPEPEPTQDMSEDDTAKEPSEFGKGIVVCLAKFSEHLWNHFYERVQNAIRWQEMSVADRIERENEAARFPRGDAARFISNVKSAFSGIRDSPEQDISMQIEMWMNGASDHFYDLDEKAPPALRELAELSLRIGHGFTGETWTKETVTRIRELWEQACLEVDAMLGVEAEWGQW